MHSFSRPIHRYAEQETSSVRTLYADFANTLPLMGKAEIV
jgi:hypothetical protein